MIALDTNILIRYIAQDHPKQSHLVNNFLESHCSPDNPGWISILVIAETFWVLAKPLRTPKKLLLDLFEHILTTKEFIIEDTELVQAALKDYKKESADFADYLIARRNLSRGCDTTYTFDKKAARHHGFKLLT